MISLSLTRKGQRDNGLVKPSWTPAPATIGMIWQILYPVIIVTFGFMFVQAIRKKLPWQVALPFAINLVSNLILTPIQFRMRNLPSAAADILIVWGTIIWMVLVVWKHYKWVSLVSNPDLIASGIDVFEVFAGVSIHAFCCFAIAITPFGFDHRLLTKELESRMIVAVDFRFIQP